MGIFGCCGKKAEANAPKSLKKRSCTDVLCLLIFFAFLGVLFFIFGLAVSTGDYNAILYSQDYLGNRCGVGSYTKADGTTVDLTSRKKAFYPRIPLDMFEQHSLITSGNTAMIISDLKLYAICVASCPTTFNIVDPAMVEDYGFDPASSITQKFASGTQPQWISATPTVDILNRCMPRTESSANEVKVCAYPSCTVANASCAQDESFTHGEWTIPAGRENECQIQLRQTATETYEIAASSEESAAVLGQVAAAVGGFFEIASSVAESTIYIVVGGIVLPIICAFAYMLLLLLFAKTIIYGMLMVLIFSLVLATFVAFSKSGMSLGGVTGTTLMDAATSASQANLTLPDATMAVLSAQEDEQWIYAVLFIILAIVTAIVIFTVLTARKKIAICAAIIKEATTVFASMPLLMFFPTWTVVAQIVVIGWFIIQMTLVNTTKAESLELAFGLVANTTSESFLMFAERNELNASDVAIASDSVDPIGAMREIVSSSNYQNLCYVITLFGYFVLTQFVGGVAWCTMSGATYYWYFFRSDDDEKTRTPIMKSLGRTLFYHSGSVAFAAFVIAICDMLRAASQYLQKQMAASGATSFVVRMAFKCLDCCLFCLKKTVKFVSYYGLVFVACQGSSFCAACYKTFFFFLSNPGQVSINATVVYLLRILATLSMPPFCGVVFYYILSSTLDAQYDAAYPAFLIFLLAVVMTISLMGVFECVVTTIFVCCFQDKAEFGSKFMSDRLAKAFGITKSADDKEPAADDKGKAKAEPDPPAEIKQEV